MLTTTQTVCIALRFFGSGTFLYTIGDAENVAKSAVCHAIRKVYLALKQFLRVYVLFPSHVRPKAVKQKFFAIAAKWPGSVHDSRIFRESHLFQRFKRDTNPGPQARYNAALTRTRARIEMTFGQLKGRFQCLKSLRVAPDRASDITVACTVLHNIATIRKERTPVVEVHPDDDLQPVHLDQPSGKAARDRIVEYHYT
ncbi:putative nuclease HARBI1 [Clarias gariepinus]